MRKITTSIVTLCALSALASACLKVETPFKNQSKRSSSNHVSAKRTGVNQQIGDADVQMNVLSPDMLEKQNVIKPSSASGMALLNDLPQESSSAESIATEKQTKEEESLLLGFPIGLIGEQNVFGGVITKITDKENETLGGLKLTDLSPLHVKTAITGVDTGTPAVSLVGCATKCDEDSEQSALISFPILGINQESNQLILDLAPIGKELDLLTMMDPEGEYTKLKTISSATTVFDYSQSTLVFDILSKMIPVDADANDPNVKVTEVTVRWYLRLNSAFNPAFSSRVPTPGVGFFKTERSKSSRITRFSTTGFGKSVKYYIKNVPEEFKPQFAKALDDWNVEFKKIIGKDLLDYEFVSKDDPRNELLIPGDIRFNIIEWDLVNKAGYGGLGPSIANQFTGETLSANVLIQGPTIIELYTKWFTLSQQVNSLREQGLTAQADKLIKQFNANHEREVTKRENVKFIVKLGKNLEMNVRSQSVELEDPIIKNHFEVVPAGMSFEKYMAGYFNEMLAHEIGHNLGLRHNFKGNLGAIENSGEGSVSRSIMEYMGRPYRHLNRIGIYDRMALSYGYKGVEPKRLDWYCTDEDQASESNVLSLLMASPECTKSDATSDPYTFWEKRIDRTIELLVAPKSTAAPVWSMADVATQVDEFILGLSSYALSAEATFATWTNFGGKADRPDTAAGVTPYVLASFKNKLCDPSLAPAIQAKETPEAAALAQANLDALKKTIETKTATWLLFKAEDLKCN